MASRSHTTFKKRQKEQARLEKAQEKMAKRLQKKLDEPGEPESDFATLEEILGEDAAVVRTGRPTIDVAS